MSAPFSSGSNIVASRPLFATALERIAPGSFLEVVQTDLDACRDSKATAIRQQPTPLGGYVDRYRWHRHSGSTTGHPRCATTWEDLQQSQRQAAWPINTDGEQVRNPVRRRQHCFGDGRERRPGGVRKQR